jgi:lipopolysaccharide/colanic/teichoic acid biosynthesis glycosyltransferase
MFKNSPVPVLLMSPICHSGFVARKPEDRDTPPSDTDLGMSQPTPYARGGKRIFDLLVSCAAICLSLPLLALSAVAIKLESHGPVLFRQRRVGREGKEFTILKLRTMLAGAPGGPRITAATDRRITCVGRFLRKSKLDELPQLFNVLRGDMSIVGPRPELPEYVAGYSLQQRRILAVKPGLTGPASVDFIDEEKLLAEHPQPGSFYRDVILPRKLELDLCYCQSITLMADLNLILRTAMRIFHRPHSGAVSLS